ncbi:MAG: hypothetical protein R3D84_01215 [Paracoccaceae bacterium]
MAAAIPDARIVLSPLIGIEFAPSPTDTGEVRGLLLTSQNGVAAIGTATRASRARSGVSVRRPPALPLARVCRLPDMNQR